MNHPYRVAAGVTAIVLAMLLALWLVVTLRTFVIIVLVAALLAAALDGPVNWMQLHLHLRRRGGAVAVVMLLGLVGLVAVGILVARPFGHQSKGLGNDLPSQVGRVTTLPIIGPHLRKVDVAGETRTFLKALPKRLTAHRDVILGVAQTALTSAVIAFTTLAVAVFMLLNGPGLADRACEQILDDFRRIRARRLAADILNAVGGYVLGNLLISVMAAAVTAVSLLVMHVPFVAVLSVAMFLLDLVPLVGATIGGAVVTAATFVLDPHPWKALVFVVIYTLYQLIESHLIYPVVMGRAIKISAFSVFLVTLAGAELGGILGALLAIPIGAALHVLIKDLLAERKGRGLVEPDSPAPPELLAAS